MNYIPKHVFSNNREFTINRLIHLIPKKEKFYKNFPQDYQIVDYEFKLSNDGIDIENLISDIKADKSNEDILNIITRINPTNTIIHMVDGNFTFVYPEAYDKAWFNSINEEATNWQILTLNEYIIKSIIE